MAIPTRGASCGHRRPCLGSLRPGESEPAQRELSISMPTELDQPSVEVQGVNKSFRHQLEDTDLKVLDDVSLFSGRHVHLRGRSQRLRKVDAPADHRRPDPARFRGRDDRWRGHQEALARPRLCLPAIQPAPLANRDSERGVWVGEPGRGEGGAAATGQGDPQARRARGLRALLPRPALGRHAAASRSRQGSGCRPVHPAHGRAVRLSRRPDAGCCSRTSCSGSGRRTRRRSSSSPTTSRRRSTSPTGSS